MATWDAAFDLSPAGSDAPSTIDNKIRETRSEVQTRQSHEHDWLGTTTATGGWHKAGSAKVYFTTAIPTNRPDGATALDSGDKGRLWYKSSTGGVMVHNGTSFVSTGVTLSTTQTVFGVKTFRSTTILSGGFHTGTSPSLKFKVVNIGDWNLQTTASFDLDALITGAGISLASVRGFTIVLRGDDGTTIVPIPPYGGSQNGAQLYASFPNYLFGYWFATQNTWTIAREVGNSPSYANWDATSYNRGWVTVWYEV